MLAMSSEGKPFIIKAYSYKEITAEYGVSWKTFKNWIGRIPDLGEYAGKKFTPAQVQKIVTHLGEPIIN